MTRRWHLEEEGVDHDEVPDGEGASRDPRRREVHHRRQRRREDRLLTEVQQRKGLLRAWRGAGRGRRGWIQPSSWLGPFSRSQTTDLPPPPKPTDCCVRRGAEDPGTPELLNARISAHGEVCAHF